MNTRHALALSMVWVAGAGSVVCAVHAVTPGNKSNSISVSLAIKSDKVRLGASPQVILTIKNISPQLVGFHTDLRDLHFHVVREGHGEPPLTMSHRHQRGIYLPGDTAQDVVGGGVTIGISPGASESGTYDLSRYYHFNVLGKYTVYGEYFDESSGKRLRTNTVAFKMIKANQ